MQFFGDTPVGMLILEIILIPLVIWLGIKLKDFAKDLAKNTAAISKQTDAIVATKNALEKLNGSLGKVLEELHEAELRDERIEGRQKGMFDQLNRIEHQTK